MSETSVTPTEYGSIMAALKILASSRSALNLEDGPITSPAWSMIHHAINYLTEQADVALRGAENTVEVLA